MKKLLTVEEIKQQESDCYDMENNYPKTGCNDCKHFKSCYVWCCEPENLIKYAQKIAELEEENKHLSWLVETDKGMAEYKKSLSNPWVKVEDKLPEENVKVIGISKKFTVPVLCRYSGADNVFIPDGIVDYFYPDYWMPIPKTPEIEEDKNDDNTCVECGDSACGNGKRCVGCEAYREHTEIF